MKKIFYLLLLLPLFCHAQNGIITTIAGNSAGGYSGDGAGATAATLLQPSGILTDAAGNIYFADRGNNCIRKINTSGIIATIAGTGTAGYAGDGGPATAAYLSGPGSIIFDASGNLYISDGANHCIRKVDASGIITTVAGTGSVGSGGDGGPATAASFNNPEGISMWAGNIYIADRGNDCIRKINTSGIASRIAGTPGTTSFGGDGGAATAAYFNTPIDVITDTNGNIYIADNGNNRVRKINTSGIINTVAGNGAGGYTGDSVAATSSGLRGPQGLAFDVAGNLYICDIGNRRIRKVDITGAGFITTIAGIGSSGFSGDGGPATAAELYPAKMAVGSNGVILASDYFNNRIRRISASAHAPYFNRTAPVFSVCESSGATFIDSLLAVTDSDAGQTESWSVLSAPSHGYLSGSYSAVSTGAPVTPSSFSYTPIVSYSGSDTFSVLVSDGRQSDTITVIVNVISFPNPGHITGADSVCPLGYDTLYNLAATPGGTWSHSDTFIVLGSFPGSLRGVSAGTDTVFYTVSNSCLTVVAHFNLTVNSAPFSGTITGPDSVCIGAAILLSDTTATPGGMWSSGDTSIARVSATGLVTGIGGGNVGIYYNAFTYCGSSPAYHGVVVAPNAGRILGRDSVCAGDTIILNNTTYGGTWSSGSIANATIAASGVVSGLAAGTAIISYTVVSAHCGTGYATQPITIKALPVAGAISGTTTVCAGGNTTLTNAVSGGRWRSSSPAIASVDSVSGIVHGASAGVATITYFVTNSCAIVDTVVAYTVNTVPAAPFISGPDSVCTGATITETGIPGSGSWALSNGNAGIVSATASMRVISGVNIGYDTLTYTVANTCGVTPVSKLIKIKGMPGVGAIAGPSSFCEGTAITLTDSVAGGTWSSGAITIASVNAGTGVVYGIAGGAAVISYAVANSCGTTVATYSETINPLPAGIISGPGNVCPGHSITLTPTVPGGSWAHSGSHITLAGGVVSGVLPGTDTIYYTISNSCGTTTISTAIVVNPLINSSVTTSVIPGINVCSGDSVTFMAYPVSGGASPVYLWEISGVYAGSGPRYTFMPAGGDIVKCHLVTSIPCPLHDTVVSDSAVITVNPVTVPSAKIYATPSDTIAFAGQIITLHTLVNNCGAASYLWFVNGLPVAGATDTAYSMNVFTNDTVFCVVSCGRECLTTPYNQTNTIILNTSPLLVNELHGASPNLTLYPNPNNGSFTIQGNLINQQGEIILQIINMMGNELYAETFFAQQGLFSRALQTGMNLPAGQYILRAVSGTGVAVISFWIK